MIFFYLLALIPIAVGGVLWIYNKRINWVEFAVGICAALLVSCVMHFAASSGVTSDIETHSGQIVSVKHYAEWVEKYDEAIYRTETYYTGSGKDRTRHSRRVFSHWSPRTRTHSEYWQAYSNIGTNYSIDHAKFNDLSNKFGGFVPVEGRRSTSEHASRMIGGDPNDYFAQNKTGWIEPVTKLVSWENRIKGAGPSAFSFRKVPENAPVYEWPENPNPWVSNRVINAPINIFKWDQLNARLGPSKRVNVIIVNFPGKSNDIVELQKAKWIGAKKNDLVLCYSSDKNGKTLWADCFSWSKSEIVKSNLKTILLENRVSDDIIPLIEAEIKKNYVLRDFEKDFSYLDIEPRPIHYFMAILIMILTQTGYWIYAHKNEFRKLS